MICLLCPKYDQTSGGGEYFQKNWVGVCGTLPDTLPLFQNKIYDFRSDQKFDTLFQTWSPEARRVTGARDKLLRHVYGSSRKH